MNEAASQLTEHEAEVRRTARAHVTTGVIIGMIALAAVYVSSLDLPLAQRAAAILFLAFTQGFIILWHTMHLKKELSPARRLIGVTMLLVAFLFALTIWTYGDPLEGSKYTDAPGVVEDVEEER